MAAIYQWFVGDEVIYTTTLYPIDVTDGLNLSVTAHPNGNLSEFPVDEAEGQVTITQIYMVVLLLSADTEVDAATGQPNVTNIEIVSLLQEADSEEDSATGQPNITHIELVDMLVTCDTPDESLQLSCVTNAANSSLTPV